MLGDLDEGCDALLFYGMTVNERIDVEDGMQILPFEELRRFVELEFVKELAPRGAGFHEWRGVGAVIAPFRWRPVFRRRGSVNEPPRCPPERFLPDAGDISRPACREPCSAGAGARINLGLHRSGGGASIRRGEPRSGVLPEVGGGWPRRV